MQCKLWAPNKPPAMLDAALADVSVECFCYVFQSSRCVPWARFRVASVAAAFFAAHVSCLA